MSSILKDKYCFLCGNKCYGHLCMNCHKKTSRRRVGTTFKRREKKGIKNSCIFGVNK